MKPSTLLSTLIKRISILALTACALTNPAFSGEKLKIFILAGQSNTVGHARAHTIATLFESDSARDKELTEMVFKEGSGASKEALNQQLEAARKLDELSGGISMSKVKDLKPGPEKTKLEAEVQKRKEAHDAYKAMVASSCVVSDHVYINSIADRNLRSGKLGIGYGASIDKIGPEYGFGLSIAEKVAGPILLIKTSWGGKSINYDFRPPSSGEYQLTEKQAKSDNIEEIKQNAGKFYRMMNEHVHSVLQNLKDNHPAYDPKAGYEIAGFVWFQGFNDQFDPAFRENYKDNMINFIKDIRKEYEVSNMPFVIGVLGTGRTKEKVDENPVSQGQRAAAQHQEFKGNVQAVESYVDYSNFSHEVFEKGWPAHYHEWDTVGSDRPYHYLGSGAFFVRLGNSFANAMADLIAKQK
jgi:hypothetical protein